MRHACVLGLVLTLVACREKTPADGAVGVSVSYGSYRPACLRVLARDAQGNEGKTDILQSEFKDPEARKVLVAVFRKPEWGRELTLEVSSFNASTGEECAGTLVEQHTSSQPVVVPQGESVPFNVTLKARDDDGDTHIAIEEGVTGTDCEDKEGAAYPGATEACSVTVDFDCDGAKACQDSDCQDKACDDGNACTTGDHCEGSGASAQCLGQAVQCPIPTGACIARAECSPETGQCVNIPAPPETACNDNDPCTENDRCGVSAQCAGTRKPCTTPPNTACYESAGACNATTGFCEYTARPSSVSCDDANACTVNDQCNGGNCVGSALPTCTARDCYRPVAACAEVCAEEPDPTKEGTACTAGTVVGKCRATGACTSFPYDPSNFNPDAIPAGEVSGPFRISCGTDANPVLFNSETLVWSVPSGCSLSPPTAKVRTMSNGVEVAVIPVRGLIIDAGAVLRLVGSRPVILAVYGDATLSGAVFANGKLDQAGAGGNRTSCGTQQGGNGAFSSGEGSGGGGGAFAANGAAGGVNKSGNAGGTAGVSQDSSLVPLVGGCPGGLGGRNLTNGGAGGGGGGALQVAVAGTLRIAHWVSVSGGGGRGGVGSGLVGEGGGGGGGGSGGGLLLEASRLELTAQARLTANGGGGGEGGNNSGEDGADGEDGSRSSKAVAAGGATSGAGQAGGTGGADGVGASAGTGGGNNQGAGGGGGGVGVIRAKGFMSCGIDSSCGATDNAGCDISPKATPECPP